MKPAQACIALGPEADVVIAALRVRAKASWDAASHMTGWDSDCFRTGRDDPAGLEPWIDTRLRPGDFIALVVDANDPATHARIPDWADRLAGLKEAAQPIAFIVGDNARGPWSSFRRLEVEALAGPARRHHCFSLRSRESPPAKASTSSCGQAVAGRNDDQGPPATPTHLGARPCMKLWMVCLISVPNGGSCAPRRLPPMSMAC